MHSQGAPGMGTGPSQGFEAAGGVGSLLTHVLTGMPL